MKKIIFILILLLNINTNAQNLNWIKNDSIKFGIGFVSTKFIDSINFIPSKWVVDIEELDTNKILSLGQLTNSDWLKLLNNDTSDYVANLLLYSLTQKDAIVLLDEKRNDWVKYGYKKKDIEYWELFFNYKNENILINALKELLYIEKNYR